MNKILEECLKELLEQHSNSIRAIYFSMNNALTISDLPDTNIRKNPKIRYIQGVELIDDSFIQVLVLTPTTDGRSKHKITKYPYISFPIDIQGQILKLAIREHTN
jgi:hypothetical protein